MHNKVLCNHDQLATKRGVEDGVSQTSCHSVSKRSLGPETATH